MTAPTDSTARTDTYDQAVLATVDRAPPLGQAQKARLAILLRDVARPSSTRRAA